MTMFGLLRGAATALLAAAAAFAGLAPHHPASAAGANWYEIESTERMVDFDPPPVDTEPEIFHWRNDRIRGRINIIDYGFFDKEGPNASLAFAKFAVVIQPWSARDNIDTYLSQWGVNYYEVGDVRNFAASLGEFEYATFFSHNNGLKKSCIGFSHWPDRRKELAGFYCRADSQPFDAGEIERVLTSVVIIGD